MSDILQPGSRFYVEIRDEIGYSEDYFDLQELPREVQRIIETAPDLDAWTYDDGGGGEWTIRPSKLV